MPPISHILFDVDGLILDTEKFYTVAQQDIAAKFGRQFTWELKAKMMGKKALEAAQILVSELGLEGQLEPEEFLRQREEVLEKLFPTTELMPGARRLIEHLHACGVPMAVATSSHSRHFELKTSAHQQLFSLFDHVVTGSDVARGKPAPDIFLTAMAQFARPPSGPSACLVFEDAPAGLAAATAAGMPCVLVPDPHVKGDFAAAAAVLGSLEEFAPEGWGLPPYGEGPPPPPAD